MMRLLVMYGEKTCGFRNGEIYVTKTLYILYFKIGMFKCTSIPSAVTYITLIWKTAIL